MGALSPWPCPGRRARRLPEPVFPVLLTIPAKTCPPPPTSCRQTKSECHRKIQTRTPKRISCACLQCADGSNRLSLSVSSCPGARWVPACTSVSIFTLTRRGTCRYPGSLCENPDIGKLGMCPGTHSKGRGWNSHHVCPTSTSIIVGQLLELGVQIGQGWGDTMPAWSRYRGNPPLPGPPPAQPLWFPSTFALTPEMLGASSFGEHRFLPDPKRAT